MNIRSVLVTFFVLVISGNTYAQQGSLSYNSPYIASPTQNRFEIGLGVAAVTGKMEAKVNDSYYNDDEDSVASDSAHGSGVSVNAKYMNVNPGSFGFLAGGSLTSTNIEKTKISIFSLDGDLAYGFNSNLIGYLGLNISSMHVEDFKTDEGTDLNDKFEPAFGGQIGMEYLVNRNLSIGASIVAYRNTWDTSIVDFELSVSGIQAQINYLF
jgi:hypothetical protein